MNVAESIFLLAGLGKYIKWERERFNNPKSFYYIDLCIAKNMLKSERIDVYGSDFVTSFTYNLSKQSWRVI